MSLENLISTVQKYFELKELDCGEFSAVKAGLVNYPSPKGNGLVTAQS